MRDTKLCQHLQLLPEPMRKRFRHYVASPYFNGVPRLTDLLDILDRHVLRYKLRAVTEADVWGHYFPATPFDQNRLRKDCTLLLQHLTAFLAEEMYQEDRLQQEVYRLQQLNILGDLRYFPGYAQDAKSTLAGVRAAGGAAFDKEIAIDYELYRYELGLPPRSSNMEIGKLVDVVELDYCVRKMELLFMELDQCRVFGRPKPLTLPAFIAFVAEHLSKLPIQTQMYFHIYHCVLDLDEATHYLEYHTLLRILQLPKREHADMYLFAINHCISKLVSDTRYLAELHELHREMLDLGLLDPEQHRLHTQFRNVVLVAAKLDRFEWAWEFVRRFEAEGQHPDNRAMYNLVKGTLHTLQDEFAAAEPYLYKVLDEAEKPAFGLEARGMLVRIYYQTDNPIGLESMLDAYRMFLRRTENLSTSLRFNHEQFIKLMRKLIVVDRQDRAALLKLQTQIQAVNTIGASKWLLERVAELLSALP